MFEIKTIPAFVFHILLILLKLVLMLGIVLLVIIPLGILTTPAFLLALIISKFKNLELVTGLQSHFAMTPYLNFPMNIVALAVLEGEVPVATATKLISERVFSITTANGNLVYEGLKKYIVKLLGFSFWKFDEVFQVANHVRGYDYKGKLSLKAGCSENDVVNVLGGLMKTPWREKRSPWEILIVSEYSSNFLKHHQQNYYTNQNQQERQDSNQNHQQDKSKTYQQISQVKTAVIFRFDHALLDGFSIIELCRVITQSEFPVPIFQIPELNNIQKCFSYVKMPFDVIANFVLAGSNAPLQNYRSPKKENSGKKVIFSISPRIPVESIKAIKNRFGVSYAAVLASLFTGAIARAREASGDNIQENFTTSLIFPQPNHPGGLSVHATIVFADFPLKSTSSIERLQKIQKSLTKLSNSTAPLAYPNVIGPLALFPSSCIALIVKLSNMLMGVSVGVSTVPVTIRPDYFEGLELSDMMFGLSPVLSAGIIVSTAGVNNQQRLTFSVKSGMFASDEITRNLGNFVMEELESLKKALKSSLDVSVTISKDATHLEIP